MIAFVRVLRICQLVPALVAALPALAQDPVSYQVSLEVVNGSLGFSGESNCASPEQAGDVCVVGENPAEIVFTLGRGSNDWKLSGLKIRDPAANWGDRLPAGAQVDFPQFDTAGNLSLGSEERGSLVIQNANRSALAVQYGVTVRNRVTGTKLNTAHAVIDTDGGAARRAE